MCIQNSIVKWSVFIAKEYTVPVCVTLKPIFDNNNNIEGISVYIIRGSRSLQNLVAISQKYCQPLLTIKAGVWEVMAKIGYSIQKVVAKVKDTVANG